MADATSMMKDQSRSFGWISIGLHWTAAILVLVMFVIGKQFSGLPRGDELTNLRNLHISIGYLAILVVATRIAWRLRNGFPKHQPSVARWETIAARVTQIGILAGTAIMIVSGPLIMWTVDRPIEFFGMFGIPSLTGRNIPLHNALELVHASTANIIIGLVALHIAGALKHLIADDDGMETAGAMFRPNPKANEPAE